MRVRQQRPIMRRSQKLSNLLAAINPAFESTQDATTQFVAMRHDLLRLLDQQPNLAKLDIDFKICSPPGLIADFWCYG